jgi:hypothetical protein
MNSKTLIETGFSECFPLKTVKLTDIPADQGTVIVIVDKELSDKPESDILYIGRTKRPSKRILGGYLGGYGGRNTRKINQMLFDEGYLEKVAISWIVTDKPRIMQEELLAKHKTEHGEVPVWNVRKKITPKSKKSPKLKPNKTSSTKSKVTTKIARAKSKSITKPKLAPNKKPKAKAEISAKTEMPQQEESGPETASNDEMTPS